MTELQNFYAAQPDNGHISHLLNENSASQHFSMQFLRAIN